MATNEDRGMTGRDVIAKTFTVGRKGYEPVEVDSYLEQIGDQIDTLRAKIDVLETDLLNAQSAPPSVADAVPVAAMAPPPPAAPVALVVPATPGASEAADIVLRMAQETSEKAITEAQRRAAEIASDAEFKAAEMQRESDRKAFEAASRSQGELRAIQTEIDDRKLALGKVDDDFRDQQGRLRTIAEKIHSLADEVGTTAINGGDNHVNDATIDLSEADSLDEVSSN